VPVMLIVQRLGQQPPLRHIPVIPSMRTEGIPTIMTLREQLVNRWPQPTLLPLMKRTRGPREFWCDMGIISDRRVWGMGLAVVRNPFDIGSVTMDTRGF